MKTEYRMWNLTIDGVKNIQEPITISFLDDTISTKKDFSVKGSNVKAIYGLNGSGKTAIVTAVKILSSLLKNKDYLIERKDVLPNLINFHKKALNISTVFGRIDDGKVARVYRYSISLAVDSSVSISKEILEKLSDRTVNGQWKTLYSITDGTIRNDVESVSPEIVAKTTNLLRTSSLPSLLDLFKEKPAGDYASTGGLVDCRRFAQSIDVFLGNSDLHDGLLDLSMLKNPEISSERKEEVGRRLSRVIMKSLSSELVPTDLLPQYERLVSKLVSFIRIFKPELKNIEIDKRVFDDETYLCDNIFVYPNTRVNFEYESTGIKKIVSLFSYLNMMVKGGIVFIDEMDANIHDVYLDRLIEFLSEEGRGQLCFTTHSLSPIKFLKRKKHSIDFLGEDKLITSWIKNGNYAPDKLYAEGMIPGSPFTFDSFDFYSIFDVSEE
jgi:AAA15 family ATPase/GTPase